jgi:phosphate starvation-inducible PhoH-like protein
MIFSKTLLLLSLIFTNTSFKTAHRFTEKNNNNNLFMRKDKISVSAPVLASNLYLPKTINQERYVNILDDSNVKIVIVAGPAGTGKTMFACLKAISLLKNGKISKIVITRPVVTAEEEIGFLPGNIVTKMDPWTKPIFDLFLEKYSKIELDNLIHNNIIEICPLAFMRGRTFKNSFIIADEMQNSSPNQMKMLLTRIGIRTNMVVTGDLNQSDLVKENGLNDIVSKLDTFNTLNNFNNFNNETKQIEIIELTNMDIERSDVVKKVIQIYDFKGSQKPKQADSLSSPSKQSEKNKNKNKNNDAALMPLGNISPNYDLFNKIIYNL